MEIVNTRINELILFKSSSEKQYVNEVKLSKRTKLVIKKYCFLIQSIQVWGFPQSNLRYRNRENKGFLSDLRVLGSWPLAINLSSVTQNCI